jgi:hypothetical protein
MKIIGFVLRGARYSDDILEIGDLAIHDEEAFPEEAYAIRTGGAFAMAGIGKESESISSKEPPDEERS